MAIYIGCAGTSAVNGVYTDLGGNVYEHSTTLYTIVLNGSTYELRNMSNDVLYQNNSLLSLTAWTVVGGSSPGPFSYTYDYTICNTLTIWGLTGGNAAANGDYTVLYDAFNNPYYRNAGNTYELTFTPEEGVDIWILSAVGGSTIGYVYVTNGYPPVGNIIDNLSSVLGSSNFSSNCSFLSCDGNNGQPAGSGFYVYNNNGNFYLYRANNNNYIRKA